VGRQRTAARTAFAVRSDWDSEKKENYCRETKHPLITWIFEEGAFVPAACLGHLARIHSSINKEKALPVLFDKLNDKDISSRVQDALDDINMFVKQSTHKNQSNGCKSIKYPSRQTHEIK
jgi:hypothetical protein